VPRSVLILQTCLLLQIAAAYCSSLKINDPVSKWNRQLQGGLQPSTRLQNAFFTILHVFRHLCWFIEETRQLFWALGVSPQAEENTRWKPRARTLICHRLFGQPNPRPLILVEYSEHTIRSISCKFVSLKYINTNTMLRITSEQRRKQWLTMTCTALVLHKHN